MLQGAFVCRIEVDYASVKVRKKKKMSIPLNRACN